MTPLHALLNTPRAAASQVAFDTTREHDWGSFHARVMQLSAVFRAEHATRYALCLDNPFDFACTLFALLTAGKDIVLPANAMPGYLARLAGSFDTLVDNLAAYPHGAVAAEPMMLEIRRDARLTLFTSGSSSAPKAIDKTLAQFDAEILTLETQWGAALADAAVLASVPHHHIYGLLFRLFWPLAAARPFDCQLCVEPAQVSERLRLKPNAFVVSSPSQLTRWPALLDLARLTPAPRAWFSSGGPLTLDTAAHYVQAFGQAPFEVFGSTETGGIAWRQQREADTPWQALPGVEVRVEADHALAVRSAHLCHADWLRTDDAARLDADGRFHLLGRLDRVAKLEGKRVSLAEVETLLVLHPWVASAAVVALPGEARHPRARLGALAVLSPAGADALCHGGFPALTRTLRRHLAQHLDSVLLPRHWRFPARLPFDERGKLPFTTLAACFASSASQPDLLAETVEADCVRYELRVPAGLMHFNGHFPGLPILPGVILVDWAWHLAGRHIPQIQQFKAIEHLKFLAPIGPRTTLCLTLAHEPAQHRVRFSYQLRTRHEATICASGQLVYRETP